MDPHDSDPFAGMVESALADEAAWREWCRWNGWD